MPTSQGFLAVARSPEQLFGHGSEFEGADDIGSLVDPITVSVPTSKLIEEAKEFLKAELPDKVWQHSHRAYVLGVIIGQTKFPDRPIDLESYYLTCLFHDIGCTPKNLKAVKLSFEYYGAILARDWLLKHGASLDLADSVAECIFRHTDFVPGKITWHGQLLQLATKLDNVGARSGLIHPDTYNGIVEVYPRVAWGNCFHDAMKEELELKPWSHTTSIPNFLDAINANSLNKFDQEASAPR